MRKPALPGQTFDMSNIRKTKKCCQHAKTSFTRANIRYVKHPKNQKACNYPKSSFTMATIRNAKNPKTKSAANIRKAAFSGQTSDMSNIRKTKKCCKHPKTSFSRANFRYFKHPKNQKLLQTCENQLFQGKHPICQTSEKLKSAANMRKAAFPGQTSDMPNIRKTKKCCKHPKSSFSRAKIRYVRHPKNQKVLHTTENQLYQGKHPICQTSEKPKTIAIIRKPALPWQTSDMPNIRKTKSVANIRKAAFPGQTSDMSNIRKPKKCCKHAKISFTRANIRYFKHPKNQKVLQTCENQLFQGKHPMCQTSNIQKPKSAANIRKAAFPGQTSDVSNIRKTKKCCKQAKTSFTRANIRYVKHPKNQKMLQLSENQLYHGKHPICQTSEKPKVLQTPEKQLFQGKHPISQTSEKPKSAANMRKPALTRQTFDMSNFRKTKKC